MVGRNASAIYSHFVCEVARAEQAWCLTCHGDICGVGGPAGRLVLPLWPDAESARYFTRLYWPDLQASPLALTDLLECCLVAAALWDVSAGVGLAPAPDAVIVPAERLRRDLTEACARSAAGRRRR